jgi:hypothetical protein
VLLKRGGLLEDKKYISKSHHLNQRIYVIRIGRYAYAVPHVVNPQTNEMFLKTIYPSRKLTKLYTKKGD